MKDYAILLCDYALFCVVRKRLAERGAEEDYFPPLKERGDRRPGRGDLPSILALPYPSLRSDSPLR